MQLKENERLDYVNDNIELIQNVDGLTFGTDALLLAGYVNGKYARGTELGGGTGIISMLLLTRDKVTEIDCLEIQEEFAELIGRNAEHTIEPREMYLDIATNETNRSISTAKIGGARIAVIATIQRTPFPPLKR